MSDKTIASRALFGSEYSVQTVTQDVFLEPLKKELELGGEVRIRPDNVLPESNKSQVETAPDLGVILPSKLLNGLAAIERLSLVRDNGRGCEGG